MTIETEDEDNIAIGTLLVNRRINGFAYGAYSWAFVISSPDGAERKRFIVMLQECRRITYVNFARPPLKYWNILARNEK